jgi:toxin ParE1/3/4
MSAYVLSPDALQDLQDVWDFISSDNANAADQLEDEFFHAFEKLAQYPRMGHTHSDITSRDVRFWTVGSYLIVYREGEAALEILCPNLRNYGTSIGRRRNLGCASR